DQVKKLITSQSDPGLVLAKLIPSQGIRTPQESDVMPVEQAIKVALENRPEMKQLQLDLDSKKANLEYTKNQLLPTVDFIASYLQNGVGGTETLRNGFQTQAGPAPGFCVGSPDQWLPGCTISKSYGGIFDSFGQLFGYQYTGYSVGISVQIPLSNRAAKGDN